MLQLSILLENNCVGEISKNLQSDQGFHSPTASPDNRIKAYAKRLSKMQTADPLLSKSKMYKYSYTTI